MAIIGFPYMGNVSSSNVLSLPISLRHVKRLRSSNRIEEVLEPDRGRARQGIAPN
ncbi:hypothetical protein VFA_002944 [Vibrio furnissii CIP 102972]|nr:hypothetical protein VFA_002944 [Vibrio furnissii CIP 102972]QDC95094.1 AraC family transcriptional regulator [Vibrio furnissii]